MYAFDLVKPKSFAQALAALRQEGAKALSGGQTLIPTLKQRLNNPASLVDLSDLEEIRGIINDGDEIIIGAATKHIEVADSALVKAAIPALAKLAGGIGDPHVRNRGTIGGSLANNDPAACYPSAVLALGATIITDRRAIAAEDYFQGMFATALEENEVIKAVRFPIPKSASYQKFDQPASRFALTGVFVARTAAGARVGVTGAGAGGVFRHEGLEAALNANFAPSAVDGVEVLADDLMSDVHATPEYRANLIKVLTRRGVDEIV